MDYSTKHELPLGSWPPLMQEMPDKPKRLFARGTLPDPALYRYLAVVGSRKHSSYAKDVCTRLISGLSGYAVVIVSGLALGIDAVAHRAAIDAKLPTVGIPGSSIDEETLYPQANVPLARDIISTGGALVSEYETGGSPGLWSFPRRNRLMAGMSTATLIIEAGEKSGTLITARLAMEYNRSVLVVPGPIFSPSSAGSNQLLREGAVAVTSSDDILEALGISSSTPPEPKDLSALSDDERTLLLALNAALPIDDLIRVCGLPPESVSVLISALEIKGLVTHRLGKIERIS